MRDDEFCQFYEQHARQLWAYMTKCSGSRSAADDIVQEAFLRMMTADLPRDMTPEHRKRYLYKIATNLLRRHKGALRHESTDNLPIEAPRVHLDDVLAVRQAIKGMREAERRLLWLAYVERLSHRDIADIMGYREISIRPLLHRACPSFCCFERLWLFG